MLILPSTSLNFGVGDEVREIAKKDNLIPSSKKKVSIYPPYFKLAVPELCQNAHAERFVTDKVRDYQPLVGEAEFLSKSTAWEL